MGKSNYIFDNGEIVEIPPIEELAKSLVYKFQEQEKDLERTKEENRKLKEDLWKDEEIQRLKKENQRLKDDMIRGFPISEEEKKDIDSWIEKHHEDSLILKRPVKGGHSIYYKFGTVPGIGYFGEICCTCGASHEFAAP